MHADAEGTAYLVGLVVGLVGAGFAGGYSAGRRGGLFMRAGSAFENPNEAVLAYADLHVDQAERRLRSEETPCSLRAVYGASHGWFADHAEAENFVNTWIIMFDAYKSAESARFDAMAGKMNELELRAKQMLESVSEEECSRR